MHRSMMPKGCPFLQCFTFLPSGPLQYACSLPASSLAPYSPSSLYTHYPNQFLDYSSFSIAFAIAVIFTRLGVSVSDPCLSGGKSGYCRQSDECGQCPDPFGVSLNLDFCFIRHFDRPGIWRDFSGTYCLCCPAESLRPAKGTGLSILTAAGDVGNALGAAVLGVVAERFGFRWVFISAALVVVFCVRYFYVTLVIKPPRQVGL